MTTPHGTFTHSLPGWVAGSVTSVGWTLASLTVSLPASYLLKYFFPSLLPSLIAGCPDKHLFLHISILCTSSLLPLSLSFLFLFYLCSFIHSSVHSFSRFIFPSLHTTYLLCQFPSNLSFIFPDGVAGRGRNSCQPGVNILVIHWRHLIPPHNAKKQTKIA